MPDISEISKLIERKKHLDTSLPRYVKSMASLYNRLSSIKLAMNYYMYNEVIEESSENEKNHIMSLLDRLNDIIRKNVLEASENFNDSIEILDSIRSEIISAMETVTAYVDRLAIYEHILNRVEFRFSDDEFDSNYYDNLFTNDIMHYILEKNDSSITNGRICEIVSQLPMRLTRQKFFELLKDAFSLYKGNSMTSLDDFSYMIKTLSGIYEPDGFNDRFPDIKSLYDILENADYSTTDKEVFDKLSDTLLVATESITKLSDLYVGIMELVNDTYIILLTDKEAINDNDERSDCHFIIKEVMDGTNPDEAGSDINDSFINLEGHQERIYAQISSNDHIIDNVIDNMSAAAEELGLTGDFRALRVCARLSSGSHFVPVDDTEEKGMAGEADIEAAYNDVFNELQDKFKKQPVIVNRAVMSIVLGSLPVFFNNVDEIQKYINVSLSQCRDMAERAACVTLIRMIIDEA